MGARPVSEPDELAGWTVTGPDGEVVASGPHTVLEASADASEAGEP